MCCTKARTCQTASSISTQVELEDDTLYEKQIRSYPSSSHFTQHIYEAIKMGNVEVAPISHHVLSCGSFIHRTTHRQLFCGIFSPQISSNIRLLTTFKVAQHFLEKVMIKAFVYSWATKSLVRQLAVLVCNINCSDNYKLNRTRPIALSCPWQ